MNPGISTNTMQNLLLIIGLIVLSLMTISMIWSVWPYVVTLLALIGAAQVYWVWRKRI